MKKIIFLLGCLFLQAGMYAAGHVVTIPSSNNVTCNGLCNGSATASVSGGVGPFSYSWSPSGGAAAAASSLCSGTYTVTCTDNSDMSTATATVTITQPTTLMNNIFPAGAPCAGTCIPINSSNTGGTPPYSYSWTPTYSLSNPTDPNPIACIAFSMTFTLVTTDAYGCTATATNTMYALPPIMAAITPTPTPCGTCNGSITCVPTGGSAPYTYNWSGPGGYTSTVANPTSLCAGNYTVNITDGMGCNMFQYTTVATTGGPTVVLDSITHINCGGAAFGSISVHATAGSGSYTYLWSNGQTTPTVSS
jgi:hypothetical protein